MVSVQPFDVDQQMLGRINNIPKKNETNSENKGSTQRPLDFSSKRENDTNRCSPESGVSMGLSSAENLSPDRSSPEEYLHNYKQDSTSLPFLELLQNHQRLLALRQRSSQMPPTVPLSNMMPSFPFNPFMFSSSAASLSSPEVLAASRTLSNPDYLAAARASPYSAHNLLAASVRSSYAAPPDSLTTSAGRSIPHLLAEHSFPSTDMLASAKSSFMSPDIFTTAGTSSLSNPNLLASSRFSQLNSNLEAAGLGQSVGSSSQFLTAGTSINGSTSPDLLYSGRAETSLNPTDFSFPQTSQSSFGYIKQSDQEFEKYRILENEKDYENFKQNKDKSTIKKGIKSKKKSLKPGSKVLKHLADTIGEELSTENLTPELIIYMEKRRKNNQAAKRSRDSRRIKEENTIMRADFLEEKNRDLQRKQRKLILENEQLKFVIKTSQIASPSPMIMMDIIKAYNASNRNS